MIRTYFDFIVEEKINELLVLIEKIDESESDDSKIKAKMNSFVKFAFSKGEKIGLSIINFFLGKIRKNKKAAFALLSVLFFTTGLSLNTIFGGLELSTSEQEYVKGLSINSDTDDNVKVPGKTPFSEDDIEVFDDEKDDEGSATKVKLSKKSIGEKEKSETSDDKDSKISLLKKKGYAVISPNSISVGQKFNKSKTVFTSADFPYKINKNATIGVKLTGKYQKQLIGRYIPEMDKVAKNEKVGLKLLALSMTYMEGYIKSNSDGVSSVSYRTNNPGNIGNTDDGSRKQFKTLGEGIKEQIQYIKKVASGSHSQYPLGKIKLNEPYYSQELKKYVPGYIFVYEGTLEQFLKIYATGPRDNNNYLNVVLSFFETYLPGQINAKTKIKDIINIGGEKDLIEILEKANPDISKSIAAEMIENDYSTKETSGYTKLNTEEISKLKKQTKSTNKKGFSIKNPFFNLFD